MPVYLFSIREVSESDVDDYLGGEPSPDIVNYTSLLYDDERGVAIHLSTDGTPYRRVYVPCDRELRALMVGIKHAVPQSDVGEDVMSNALDGACIGTLYPFPESVEHFEVPDGRHMYTAELGITRKDFNLLAAEVSAATNADERVDKRLKSLLAPSQPESGT